MTTFRAMRPIQLILFSLTFVLSIALNPSPLIADENSVFARVNGKEIPMTAFETSFNFLKISSSMFHNSSSVKTMSRLEAQAIDILLNRELLLQDAQAKGVKPTEKEIRAFLEHDKGKYGGEPKLLDLLERGSITFEDYQVMVSDAYRVRYYIENFVMAKAQVTKAQCLAYYEENLQEYRPLPQVYVSSFTFTLPDPTDEVAITRIRDLQQLTDYSVIRDRSNRIARTSSRSLDLRSEIGKQIFEDRNPDLWETVRDLKVDTASYRKVDERTHMIIFLNRKDLFEQKVFGDVIEEIREKLLKDELNNFAANNLKKLQEAADIEIFYQKQQP